MNEKKQRQISRERILSENPTCIFCGGLETATTIDHIPPKVLFVEKQWPITYEFPSCESCNNGSKRYDDLAGFLSLLSPEPKTRLAEEYDQKRFRAIKNKYPNIVGKMFDIPTNQKRKFVRDARLELEPGATYKDFPLVTLPNEIIQSVEVLAAKICKALHFKHTGTIVPANASIRFRWFTNASRMLGEDILTPEVMNLATQMSEIKRNNASLKNQFDYKYQVANDASISMFVCAFGNSWGFIAAISTNPDVLENIVTKLNKEHNRKDAMKRIYWPLPKQSSDELVMSA